MNTDNHKDKQSGLPMSLVEQIQVRYASLNVRKKPLKKEITRFGHWLEYTVAPVCIENEIPHIELYFNEASQLCVTQNSIHDQLNLLNELTELWPFLINLGIHSLKLDMRLEFNQIEDIFIILYACRKNLKKAKNGQHVRGIARKILSDQGLHAACTHTSVKDGTLIIAYSYCVLSYSKAVRWFENRHKDFRDHRALFHAAPKYAVIVAALATTAPIIHSLINRDWFLLISSSIEAAMLIAIVYLFFSIVGSVEYDNEEKTYNLNLAYRDLKKYTNRIQLDIRRAQNVQHKILPSQLTLPLQDKIEWAYLYEPAEEIGGDYFDAVELDNQRIAFIFSDVSGHGMSAAFITAILKTTFYAWLEKHDEIDLLCRQLNKNLCRFTPTESFAAVFVGLYNTNTKCLEYANLGHHPEAFILSNECSCLTTLDQARNLILGIDETIDLCYSNIILKEQDYLVLMSDGIIESLNNKGNQLGIENLIQSIQNSHPITSTDLVNNIKNAVENYSSGAEQLDDRTVLALKIRKKA